MASASETRTSEYEVTERAGPRVAGRVVSRGQILVLTEDEAEFGLREGSLVAKGKTLPKVYSEPSKRIEVMRAEAAALRSRSALPPEVADEPQPAPPPATPAGPKASPAADAGKSP